MSCFSDLVADHVRDLGVETPAEPRRGVSPVVSCRVELAANQSPYGPSPKAMAAMRDVVEKSHLYPDNDARELRQKIAQLHSVEVDEVIVSAGLTGLLTVIARTLLQPGRMAITSECSFVAYGISTRAVGARLVETTRRNHGYDLDAVLSAIEHSTRIVFLANPNNPTGTLIESRAVERFLQQVPPHVVVVIDEAYYDYARYFAAARGVEYSSPDYVRRWQNVVMLRTFSKAHGLAGLRIGYGLGRAGLIAYFARLQDTFSVSGVAQAAALAALEDTEHVRFAVENNAMEAERLANEISRLGCRVVPTWANFLCCDLGQDAAAVARKLRAEGVVVLPLGEWGAPTSLRITVGTAEQNRIFLRSFRRILR